MNPLDSLHQYLTNPDMPVDPQWVETMAAEYPYFTLPATLLLSRPVEGLPATTIRDITSRLALNFPDPTSLLSVVDADAARWIGIYPPDDTRPTVTTDQAIDTFINTYGNPEPNEDAVLERLIFNPTPDYAQILASEEEASQPVPGEAPAGSQDDRINNFIIKSKRNQGHFPPTVEQPSAQPEVPTPASAEPATPPPTESGLDATLSESLAKAYISQRRFDEAYEIIHTLSLNYPEKSIYFADQLRFLRKLIINQRHLDKKTTK